MQKLWGCLGVTAPDTELAAQLAAGPLSLNMPVRRLMKNPQASALLQAVLGDMWQAIVSNPLSQGISLREISAPAGGIAGKRIESAGCPASQNPG